MKRICVELVELTVKAAAISVAMKVGGLLMAVKGGRNMRGGAGMN